MVCSCSSHDADPHALLQVSWVSGPAGGPAVAAPPPERHRHQRREPRRVQVAGARLKQVLPRSEQLKVQRQGRNIK